MFLINAGSADSSPMTTLYIFIGIIGIVLVIFLISFVGGVENSIFKKISGFFKGSSPEPPENPQPQQTKENTIISSVGSFDNGPGTGLNKNDNNIATDTLTNTGNSKKSGKK